jgi:hypothetical protein
VVVRGAGSSWPTYYLIDLEAGVIKKVTFPEEFGSPRVLGLWDNKLVVNAIVPASDILAPYRIMLYGPETQNYTQLVDGANAVMGDRSFTYNTGPFDSTLRFYNLESDEQVTDIPLPPGSIGVHNRYISSPVGVAEEAGIYDGSSLTNILFVYPFSTGIWQQVTQGGYLDPLRTKIYGDLVAFVHDLKLKIYNISSGLVEETGADIDGFKSFDIWGKTVVYSRGLGIEVIDLDTKNVSHLMIPSGIWIGSENLALYDKTIVGITPDFWIVKCIIK